MHWKQQYHSFILIFPLYILAKVAADANAAAWAAYYAQFYNQPGTPQPQPGQIAPAQPAAQPATPAQNGKNKWRICNK